MKREEGQARSDDTAGGDTKALASALASELASPAKGVVDESGDVGVPW